MQRKGKNNPHPEARSLKLKAKQGFTIIELLVTIVIFAVVTSVVLVSQSRFGSTVLLTNLAYEVALSVREAQIYGISIREFGGSFESGYGVNFKENDHFVLFADEGRDRKYLGSHTVGGCAENSECIKVLKLRSDHSIQKFCAVLNNDFEICNPEIASMDITFLRPDPEALIKTHTSSGSQTDYKSAKIYLSASGNTKVVEVFINGQISIK